MHVCMYVPNMLQPLNSIVIILSDNRTMYSDGEEGRGEEGGGRREGGVRGERGEWGGGREVTDIKIIFMTLSEIFWGIYCTNKIKGCLNIKYI